MNRSKRIRKTPGKVSSIESTIDEAFKNVSDIDYVKFLCSYIFDNIESASFNKEDNSFDVLVKDNDKAFIIKAIKKERKGNDGC